MNDTIEDFENCTKNFGLCLISAFTENVRVLFRVKPVGQLPRCVRVTDQNIAVFDSKSEKVFNFDWIGDENTIQVLCRLIIHINISRPT